MSQEACKNGEFRWQKESDEASKVSVRICREASTMGCIGGEAHDGGMGGPEEAMDLSGYPGQPEN